MPDCSHVAAFASGVFVCAGVLALLRSSKVQAKTTEKDEVDGTCAETTSRAERKLLKLQKSVQEVVFWGDEGLPMLGLLPRLWIEVLDPQHRYGTLLYGYFSRWELSNTEEDFFQWLDQGPGALIDLPKYPRRLLDESRILYLTRVQQQLFEVRIKDGSFLWEWDGEPVSLPPKQCSKPTPREQMIQELFLSRTERGHRRDKLLADARTAVESALAGRVAPTLESMHKVAEPLIQEGLLCQLRDPWFAERLAADHKRRFGSANRAAGSESPTSARKSTPISWSVPAYFQAIPDVMPASYTARGELLRQPMPETLKPGVDWHDFLNAIDHDEGLKMDTPFPKASDRVGDDGIFVVDKFGVLHCGMKVRGVFQHSSFVRGHCVRVAGGITLEHGELKRLSPHSGHYQPMIETFEEMQRQWNNKGVDFSHVEVKPFVKK